MAVNSYCPLTKPGTLDWSRSNWFVIPTLSYADFTALAELPKVKLNATTHTECVGEGHVTHVRLENPSKNLAVFLRLKIDCGKKGREILPVVWKDNYVSPMSGETREITAACRASALGNETPYLEVKGWNAD